MNLSKRFLNWIRVLKIMLGLDIHIGPGPNYFISVDLRAPIVSEMISNVNCI